jgi:CRISPR-associated protein Cas1
MESLIGTGAGAGLPDLLPARMLNEFVYCPRLFHLEWVQGEWADSAETVSGRHVHRRVDRPGGEVPLPEELGLAAAKARSVTMSAPIERLIANIDLLEIEDGEVRPVDYKRGKAPDLPNRAWDPDRVQVCAQALILRENGYVCREALVYYAASKTRVVVPIDADLVQETRGAVGRAFATAAKIVAPEPLVDSPKCPRCSLVGICLPDESRAFQLPGIEVDVDVRRLSPARDDATPVYVQSQGAVVGKDGEQIEVRSRDGVFKSRLIDTSQLSLFGNVQVTAQALSMLLDVGIPVCHFSFGGWFRGITHALGNRNCDLRLHQYRVATDPERSLEIARRLVAAKLLNCRTLLRRNHESPPADALAELRRLAEATSRAATAEVLLGLEGLGARAYFGAFAGMIAEEPRRVAGFDFEGRNRRPPRDPVNALLSLAYSILAKDFTVTLLSVGLDPYLGFLHRPRFGRAALALDLMEEFRPLIADSVVLQLINNGEVDPDSFVRRGGAVALTDAGRKKFFLAYERRMNHLIRHPVFGYRISYRRILEVQARLLARHLSGELPNYPGFRTR